MRISRTHSPKHAALFRALPALALALSLAGCGGKNAPDAPKQASEPDLTILHVNDTHSYIAGVNEKLRYCVDDAECKGGYARIAAEIQKVKGERRNTLVLHAGDSFQGTLFFSVHRWPMLAELDGMMPYDAMTPGNHEYDDGCTEFSGYVPKLPFPMLAANIAAAPGTDLAGAGIKPYMIREIGGRKVGVIGLSNDSGAILATACPNVTFPDHEAVLKRAVKELQGQGVDRIIALTHLGLPEDRRLARNIDGLDVVVGGHTHSYIGPDSEVGPYPIVEHSPNGDPVLVVTAGYATQWLGELSVNFDAKGVPANWSGGPTALAKDMPRDPAVAAKVAEYADALATLRKAVVGSHDTVMNDGLQGCREAECFGALLTADAMLDYGKPYGAQIALCNSGAVRASIEPGDITRGDILNAFPYANSIVVRELTGAQILAALEHGVRGEGDEEYIGLVGGPRMLQPAGLRYVADESRPGQAGGQGGTAGRQGPDPAARHEKALRHGAQRLCGQRRRRLLDVRQGQAGRVEGTHRFRDADRLRPAAFPPAQTANRAAGDFEEEEVGCAQRISRPAGFPKGMGALASMPAGKRSRACSMPTSLPLGERSARGKRGTPSGASGRLPQPASVHSHTAFFRVPRCAEHKTPKNFFGGQV